MATRLIGTDTTNPRLPAVVVAATQGLTAADLAAGDTLASANAYTDVKFAAAGGGTAAGFAQLLTRGELDSQADAGLLSPGGLYVATDESPNHLSVATSTTTYLTADTLRTYSPAPPPTLSQAVGFNAESDRYEVSANGLENSSFTMACFVYPETNRSYYQAIMSIDLDSFNWTSLVTGIDGATLWWSAGRSASVTGRIIPGFQLTAGQWYFIAASFDASGTDTLYWGPVNQPLSKSSAVSQGIGVTGVGGTGWTLSIGGAMPFTPEWLHGRIAGVKLWTAALTEAELNAEAGNVVAVRSANLWASYPFSSGPSTSDASGHGRTLTPFGSLDTVTGPPFTQSPPLLPNPPGSVTGFAQAGAVLLAWSAPTNTWVSDYAVQWATAAAPATWTTFSEAVSPIPSVTVTGLSNGTAYIFRVAAINPAGQSTWSTTIAPVTPVTPVGAVHFDSSADNYRTAVSGLGGSSVTVAFWARLDNDRNAASMFVSIDDVGGSSWFSIGTHTNGTELYWTTNGGNTRSSFDMVVGTWYHVAVVYDLSGTDTLYWSTESTGYSTDSTPTSGTLTGVSNGWQFRLATSVSGEWADCSLAAVKVWSAALSQAELETEKQSYSAVRTANLWANYRLDVGPSVADDSGNGHVLTVAGVPTTAAGPTLTPVTPTAPGAPATVTGIPGDGQVSVSWPLPASNGSSITDYVVQWATAAAPTAWTTFSEGVSATPAATVTGLTNGTAYIFRVAAVNGIGQGPYSAASSSVTPTVAGLAIAIGGSGIQYQTSATGLGGGDVTMACWVNLIGDRNVPSFWLSVDTASAYFSLGTHTNGTEIYWTTTTGSMRSSVDLVVGTWQYVAVVYQLAGADTMYWGASGGLSSLAIATSGAIGTPPTTSASLRIGGTRDSGEWVNAAIAGVKIWNRALTSFELQTERGSYAPVSTTGLWAAYPFNLGTSTSDASGNGHTLSVTGAPTTTTGPPGVT